MQQDLLDLYAFMGTEAVIRFTLDELPGIVITIYFSKKEQFDEGIDTRNTNDERAGTEPEPGSESPATPGIPDGKHLH